MKAAGCSWRVTTSSIEDRRRTFDDIEILLPGHPENPIDALVLEGGNENIRSLHFRSLLLIGQKWPPGALAHPDTAEPWRALFSRRIL